MESNHATEVLAALEGPKHRHQHASNDYHTLKNAPVPSSDVLAKMHAGMLAAAEKEKNEAHAAYKAHVDEHEASGGLLRKIDIAAQAVLDARGEAHTDQSFVGGKNHEK